MHRAEVARFAEECQRFARLTTRVQQLGSPLGGEAPLLAREPRLCLLEQEFAKQHMVVVRRRRAAATVGEEMPAVKVFEQSRSLFVAGELDGLRLRERWWNRGEHEHTLVRGLRAIEDLAREVLEDRVLPFADRLVGCGTGAIQMLAQQHQCRHPTVALPRDALQLLGVEMQAAEHGFRLVRSAAQRRRLDARHAATCDETGELGRRLGARDHDDGDALRDFLHSVRESAALLGSGVRIMEAVQNDHRRTWQHRKELAKVSPRKTCEILLRLRVEVGQRCGVLSDQLQCRHSHVVDERRGIAVRDVDLVPQVTQFPRFEVARDQRRLAGTRRRADPDEGFRQGFVEECVQARPRNRVVKLGPRELGESGWASGQGCCESERRDARLSFRAPCLPPLR